MVVRVAHAKTLAIADDPDAVTAGEALPSDWNDDHVVEGLGTAAEADTGDFAAASHTHAASEISDSTAAGRALLTAADAAAQRTALALGTAATSATTDFAAATHSHAVSDVTGLQTALDAKAPLASPTFTGTPAAPTAAAGTNTTQIATTGFVKAAIDVVLGGVSSAFDTLSEIATALAGKLTAANNLSDLANAGTARTNLGLGTAATSASTAFAAASHTHTASEVTNFSTAADARVAAAVGVSVQAYDAELAALAGLTSAANKLPYFTGSGTAGLADLTTAGRALLDDADAAAQRTTLGLGTAATSASTDFAGSAAVALALIPQGRLTLVSGTPVLTSDQTAKTAVYYTPHVGDQIPIYSGSAWEPKTFAELTLNLDTSNHLSGSLYDVFVWNNSGTIAIGTGPAWTTATAGSGARGTGAGTTELELFNGKRVNKNSITLKNGAGSGTSGIAARTATYVGTIYCTANGQTGMAMTPTGASGGSNNVLGVWNAYNRVRTIGRCLETASSWTYATGTWRAFNNSNSNRISYVDGLGQSAVTAQIKVQATGFPNIGVNRNSTSAAPDIASQIDSAMSTAAPNFLPPILGLNYVQAMEVAASGTATFFGSSSTPTRQHSALLLEIEM